MTIGRRAAVGLDVMIIGAAKSGTSTLVRLLWGAPGVSENPTQAELSYFLRDEEYARGVAVARHKYFDDDRPDALRVGKNAGLMYSRTALERLADDSPSVLAVALLRDPVARAFSAYNWAFREGFETASFPEAIRREMSGDLLDLPRPELRQYVARGEYVRFLKQARELLGPEQLEILVFEEFTPDPITHANRLLNRFGRAVDEAPPTVLHANRAKHVRSQRVARLLRSPKLRAPLRATLPVRLQGRLARTARRLNERPLAPVAHSNAIDAETRELLEDHFRPFSHELEQLLGRETGWSGTQESRSR